MEGSSPLSYLVDMVEGGWGELDFTERQAFSSDSFPFSVKQRLSLKGHGKREGKVVYTHGAPEGRRLLSAPCHFGPADL